MFRVRILLGCAVGGRVEETHRNTYARTHAHTLVRRGVGTLVRMGWDAVGGYGYGYGGGMRECAHV